jgi:hypothetical protein
VLQGVSLRDGRFRSLLFQKKDNLEKLARALASFHPLLRAIPNQLPFRLDVSALRSGMNFTLTTDVGDMDVLGEVTGIGSYQQVEAFQSTGSDLCKILIQ